MFGYIRICKPQMKICEYQVYQSVYCTLCRHLGKQLGLPARMLLNYDYTFLTMVMIALSGQTVCFVQGRCVFNPTKRCGNCTTHAEAYAYTAALTAIMFYHKLRDNIHDAEGGRRFLWRLLMPYASHVRRRAVKRCPEEDGLVDAYIDKQLAVERQTVESGEVNVDALCEPTAEVIAAIAERLSQKESDRIILRHFGYFLGRWIYTIDALDDLQEDVRQGAFNPLALKFGLTAEDVAAKSDAYEQARCFGNDSLNLSLSEAIKYYELLEWGDFKPILDNILYQGMAEAQKAALFPAAAKGRGRRFERELNGHE